MRGRAGLSGFLQTAYRIGLCDPSSVRLRLPPSPARGEGIRFTPRPFLLDWFQRSKSAVDRMEAFFPRSGFGQGAPKAPAKRRRVPPEAGNVKMRAVLDEIRNLGTTLRHAIDGEVAVGGWMRNYSVRPIADLACKWHHVALSGGCWVADTSARIAGVGCDLCARRIRHVARSVVRPPNEIRHRREITRRGRRIAALARERFARPILRGLSREKVDRDRKPSGKAWLDRHV